MQTKRLTALALFTTLSLAVYAAESAIPPLLPLPGIRLGLANIVTLILLRDASARDALLVLAARILLSALLFGSFMSLLYSLLGGCFALGIMTCCTKLLQKKLTFLTGAAGGLAHNMGQLLAAYLITASPGVMAYLPYLIPGGILTGLFTGLCAGFLSETLLKRFHPFDR